MGRIWPKTLVDFYEPRPYRAYIKNRYPHPGLDRRTKRLLMLAFVLYMAAFAAPHITRWVILHNSPGYAGPSIARIILFTALYGLLPLGLILLVGMVTDLFRVRFRMTDKFCQRCHGQSIVSISWKDATCAQVDVIEDGGSVWTVLILHRSKKNRPIRVGIPNDQPIEPILRVLAQYGVRASFSNDPPPQT